MIWMILEGMLFAGIYLCGVYDDIDRALDIKKDIKYWEKVMGRGYYK